MYENLICNKCGQEIDEDACVICLKQLALEVSEYFELKQRHNTDKYIVCCKDGTPSWVREMVHEAHSDMFPDDYKYKFIHNAINDIAENGLDEPHIEADPYTHNLMKWASSHGSRIDYCNEAIQDGSADRIEHACMCGQEQDRKSTRLNSSHGYISYAVFCLEKK